MDDGNKKTYVPKPVDTSDIELPDDLKDLIGELADNNHEVWAEGRIKDGWTYGPVRDDEKKQHPDLVPPERLTEEEKAYDVNTSVQNLKLIMKLGYNIVKK